MRTLICPSCQSKLNAFRLEAPKSRPRAFWDRLRGIVECPTCRAHILQQPGDGLVSGVFLLGAVLLALIGSSLEATIEVLLAMVWLWTAGITIWLFKRRWVVAPEQSPASGIGAPQSATRPGPTPAP
ncbi:MAG TPA: hypothetical protein VN929_13960 [Burkholderiales bacterium]|nr:hypothetical protein [Burkholderiales bacterium]